MNSLLYAEFRIAGTLAHAEQDVDYEKDEQKARALVIEKDLVAYLWKSSPPTQ